MTRQHNDATTRQRDNATTQWRDDANDAEDDADSGEHVANEDEDKEDRDFPSHATAAVVDVVVIVIHIPDGRQKGNRIIPQIPRPVADVVGRCPPGSSSARRCARGRADVAGCKVRKGREERRPASERGRDRATTTY